MRLNNLLSTIITTVQRNLARGCIAVLSPSRRRIHSSGMHSRIGTLLWAGTCPPSKVSLPVGGSGHPSNTWFQVNSHESAPKRHLDRFNRLCTAHSCVQQTDAHRHTHNATCDVLCTSVATRRIFALRAGDAA